MENDKKMIECTFTFLAGNPEDLCVMCSEKIGEHKKPDMDAYVYDTKISNNEETREEHTKALNRMLLQDNNTLAGIELESIDRVVKYRYYCVCYHEKNHHKSVDIDHPLNSDSMQMTETWGCKKCDCGKYREYRKEEIDYSVEVGDVADDGIYGIDNELESIDRVVKFLYSCVCGDSRSDHNARELTKEEIIELDLEEYLDFPQIVFMSAIECNKCDCKEYEED